MSRTIRRTKGYKGWGFGTERSDMGRVRSSPEDIRKELIRFQMDRLIRSGPDKWFRGQEHNSMRMLVKGELARFWKDPDYEVQVERRRKNDYWN